MKGRKRSAVAESGVPASRHYVALSRAQARACLLALCFVLRQTRMLIKPRLCRRAFSGTEKQQALLLAMEKVQPSMHHSAQSGRHRMIEMVRARYVSNNCQQQYDIDCSQRLVGKLTLFISGIAGILMLPKYMKAGRVSLCIPYGCAVQCIRQQECFHKTIDIECAILHIWSPHVTRARKC